MVIRYSYLWHREYRMGQEEGVRDRPCAIVAAIVAAEDGTTRVLVLPITHTAPDDPHMAIEIPPSIKGRLNLDPERSWIVVAEWNEFAWPGPDLRPVGRGRNAGVAYGFLPAGFFATVRDRFVAAVEAGRTARVRRTE